MKPRTFEFRLSGARGIPALLVSGVIAVLLALVVALVLLIGLAVIAAGLAVSAGAVLWYAVRRRLTHGSSKAGWQFHDQSTQSEVREVQEIEFEILPKQADRVRNV